MHAAYNADRAQLTGQLEKLSSEKAQLGRERKEYENQLEELKSKRKWPLCFVESMSN